MAGMRYQLKRKLGQGRFSEVWLAWDRQWEHDVALKLLPQWLRQERDFVEELRQRVTRTRQLSQPAIARVLGLVQDSEVIGVEMEYVDGWSLAVLKVDRPQKHYRSKELEPWLRELCPALDVAHKGGLVHQDLRPSSLLVNAREQVKLTDFGVAHCVKRALARQGVPLPESIAYLSPQQAQGGEPGPADDVYALGATLYDLLTGTPPFYTGEILAQVCELPPAPMSQRLAELKVGGVVPAAWEEAIAACLAKEPSQRPLSAGQLLQRLERPPARKAAVSPVSAPGFMGAGYIGSRPAAGRASPRGAAKAGAVAETAAGPGPGPLAEMQKEQDTGALAGGMEMGTAVAGRPAPRAPAAARQRWLVLWVVLVALAALGLAAAFYFRKRNG